MNRGINFFGRSERITSFRRHPRLIVISIYKFSLLPHFFSRLSGIYSLSWRDQRSSLFKISAAITFRETMTPDGWTIHELPTRTRTLFFSSASPIGFRDVEIDSGGGEGNRDATIFKRDVLYDAFGFCCLVIAIDDTYPRVYGTGRVGMQIMSPISVTKIGPRHVGGLLL